MAKTNQLSLPVFSKVKYVYDATLGIHPSDGATLATLATVLMGKRIVGDIYLRRFNTVDISKDDEGAHDFLMQVYKDKDVLLDSYKQTGGRSFTERNDFPHVQVNTHTHTHTYTHTHTTCNVIL